MRHPFLKKVTAIFLCISFTFSSVGNADVGAQFIAPSGRDESRPYGRFTKTIFYIQDAHDSLEAQKNIAKLVRRFVERDGVKTVFEEGYEGPVPSDELFRLIKNPAIKEKISYFLMDKLRLGGAEYAHVNRKKDFKLIGADHFDLHGKNIEDYRNHARFQKRNAEDLEKMSAVLAKLEQRYLPAPVKEWIKLKKRLDSGQMEILDYRERLLKMAGKLDQSQLSETSLSASFVKEFFEKIERLENEFAEKSLADDRQRKIFRMHKSLELLKRLNKIELTPAEYEAVQKPLNELTAQDFADWTAKETGKTVVLSNQWEKGLRPAREFYETALAREAALEKPIDDFLRSNETKAVLVYGGFHRGGIVALLKKKNVRVKVISPRISREEPRHRKMYRALMSQGYKPFEFPAAMSRASRYASIYWDMRFGKKSALQQQILSLEDAVQFKEITQKKIERNLEGDKIGMSLKDSSTVRSLSPVTKASALAAAAATKRKSSFGSREIFEGLSGGMMRMASRSIQSNNSLMSAGEKLNFGRWSTSINSAIWEGEVIKRTLLLRIWLAKVVSDGDLKKIETNRFVSRTILTPFISFLSNLIYGLGDFFIRDRGAETAGEFFSQGIPFFLAGFLLKLLKNFYLLTGRQTFEDNPNLRSRIASSIFLHDKKENSSILRTNQAPLARFGQSFHASDDSFDLGDLRSKVRGNLNQEPTLVSKTEIRDLIEGISTRITSLIMRTSVSRTVSLSFTSIISSLKGATASAIRSIFRSMDSSIAPTWDAVKYSSFINEVLLRFRSGETLSGIEGLVNIIINHFFIAKKINNSSSLRSETRTTVDAKVEELLKALAPTVTLISFEQVLRGAKPAAAKALIHQMIKREGLDNRIQGKELRVMVHPLNREYILNDPGFTQEKLIQRSEYYSYLQRLLRQFEDKQPKAFVVLVDDDPDAEPRAAAMARFLSFLHEHQSRINPDHVFMLVPTYFFDPVPVAFYDALDKMGAGMDVLAVFLRYLSPAPQKIILQGEFYKFVVNGLPVHGCVGGACEDLQKRLPDFSFSFDQELSVHSDKVPGTLEDNLGRSEVRTRNFDKKIQAIVNHETPELFKNEFKNFRKKYGDDFIDQNWADIARLGNSIPGENFQRLFKIILPRLVWRKITVPWVQEHWADMVEIVLKNGKPGLDFLDSHLSTFYRDHGIGWVSTHWKELVQLTGKAKVHYRPGGDSADDLLKVFWWGLFKLRESRGGEWIEEHSEGLFAIALNNNPRDLRQILHENFSKLAEVFPGHDNPENWPRIVSLASGAGFYPLTSFLTMLVHIPIWKIEWNSLEALLKAAGKDAPYFMSGTLSGLEKSIQSRQDFQKIAEALTSLIQEWPQDKKEGSFADLFLSTLPALQKFVTPDNLAEIGRDFFKRPKFSTPTLKALAGKTSPDKLFPMLDQLELAMKEVKDPAWIFSSAIPNLSFANFENIAAIARDLEVLAEEIRRKYPAGLARETEMQWLFGRALSEFNYRGVIHEKNLLSWGKAMIQTGSIRWNQFDVEIRQNRHVLKSIEEWHSYEADPRSMPDWIFSRIDNEIAMLQTAAVEIAPWTQDANPWIKTEAKGLEEELSKAAGWLAEFKPKLEKIQKEAERYESWEKRMTALMEKMIKAYRSRIAEESLALGAHTGHESGIASVAPSIGMGLVLNQSLQMNLTQELSPLLSLHGLVTVDEELALAHEEKFIRALNALLPHELSHVLYDKKKGRRWSVKRADFDPAPFAAFGTEEEIAAIAKEAMIDKIGFDLATRVYMHSESEPAGMSVQEKAVAALQDVIEIFIEHIQSDRMKDEADPKKVVLNLARFEGVLNHHLKSSPLAARLHTLAESLISAEQREAYDRLVQAYGAAYAQTQFEATPKLPPPNRSEVRRQEQLFILPVSDVIGQTMELLFDKKVPEQFKILDAWDRLPEHRFFALAPLSDESKIFILKASPKTEEWHVAEKIKGGNIIDYQQVTDHDGRKMLLSPLLGGAEKSPNQESWYHENDLPPSVNKLPEYLRAKYPEGGAAYFRAWQNLLVTAFAAIQQVMQTGYYYADNLSPNMWIAEDEAGVPFIKLGDFGNVKPVEWLKEASAQNGFLIYQHFMEELFSSFLKSVPQDPASLPYKEILETLKTPHFEKGEELLRWFHQAAQKIDDLDRGGPRSEMRTAQEIFDASIGSILTLSETERARLLNIFENNLWAIQQKLLEPRDILQVYFGGLAAASDFLNRRLKEGIQSWSQLLFVAELYPQLIETIYVDFDGTLFEPAGYVATEKWFRDEMQTYGKNSANVRARKVFEEKRLLKARFFKTLEPGLAERIKNLQDKGVKWTGLTARRPQDAQLTQGILSSLGIEMPVLYAGTTHRKSKLLEEAFQQRQKSEKLWIFLDDRMPRVLNARRTAALADQKLLALHYQFQAVYSAAESRRSLEEAILSDNESHAAAHAIDLFALLKSEENAEERWAVYQELLPWVQEMEDDALTMAYLESISDFLSRKMHEKLEKEDRKALLETYFEFMAPHNQEMAVRAFEEGKIAVRRKEEPGSQMQVESNYEWRLDEKNAYFFLEPLLRVIKNQAPDVVLLPDTGARPFYELLARFTKREKMKTKILIFPVSRNVAADTSYELKRWIKLVKNEILPETAEERELIQEFSRIRRGSIQEARNVILLDDNVTSGETALLLREVFRQEFDTSSFSVLSPFAYQNPETYPFPVLATFRIFGDYAWKSGTEKVSPSVTVATAWEEDPVLRGAKSRNRFEYPPSKRIMNARGGEFRLELLAKFMQDYEADRAAFLKRPVPPLSAPKAETLPSANEDKPVLDSEAGPLPETIILQDVRLQRLKGQLPEWVFQEAALPAEDLTAVSGKDVFAYEIQNSQGQVQGLVLLLRVTDDRGQSGLVIRKVQPKMDQERKFSPSQIIESLKKYLQDHAVETGLTSLFMDVDIWSMRDLSESHWVRKELREKFFYLPRDEQALKLDGRENAWTGPVNLLWKVLTEKDRNSLAQTKQDLEAIQAASASQSYQVLLTASEKEKLVRFYAQIQAGLPLEDLDETFVKHVRQFLEKSLSQQESIPSNEEELEALRVRTLYQTLAAGVEGTEEDIEFPSQYFTSGSMAQRNIRFKETLRYFLTHLWEGDADISRISRDDLARGGLLPIYTALGNHKGRLLDFLTAPGVYVYKPRIGYVPSPERPVSQENFERFLNGEWYAVAVDKNGQYPAPSYKITGLEKVPSNGNLKKPYFSNHQGGEIYFFNDSNHGAVGVLKKDGQAVDAIYFNQGVIDSLDKPNANERTLGWLDIAKWMRGEKIKPRPHQKSSYAARVQASDVVTIIHDPSLHNNGKLSVSREMIGREVIGVLRDDLNHGTVFEWFEYDSDRKGPKNDRVINAYYFQDEELEILNMRPGLKRDWGWADIVKWMHHENVTPRPEGKSSFVFDTTQIGLVMIKTGDLTLPQRGQLVVGKQFGSRRVIGVLRQEENHGTVLEWFDYDETAKGPKGPRLNAHFWGDEEGPEMLNDSMGNARTWGWLDVLKWLKGQSITPRADNQSFIRAKVQHKGSIFVSGAKHVLTRSSLQVGADYENMEIIGILKKDLNHGVMLEFYEYDADKSGPKNDRLLNAYAFRNGKLESLSQSGTKRTFGYWDIHDWALGKAITPRPAEKSFVVTKVQSNGVAYVGTIVGGRFSIGASYVDKKVMGILRQDMNHGTVLEWYEYDEAKAQPVKEKMIAAHYIENGKPKYLKLASAVHDRDWGWLDLVKWKEGEKIIPRFSIDGKPLSRISGHTYADGKLQLHGAEQLMVGRELGNKNVTGFLVPDPNLGAVMEWYENDKLISMLYFGEEFPQRFDAEDLQVSKEYALGRLDILRWLQLKTVEPRPENKSYILSEVNEHGVAILKTSQLLVRKGHLGVGKEHVGKKVIGILRRDENFGVVLEWFEYDEQKKGPKNSGVLKTYYHHGKSTTPRNRIFEKNPLGALDVVMWLNGISVKPRAEGESRVYGHLDDRGVLILTYDPRFPKSRYITVGKNFAQMDVVGILEEDLNHGVVLNWYEWNAAKKEPKKDRILNTHYYEQGSRESLNASKADDRTLGFLDVVAWLRGKKIKLRKDALGKSLSYVVGKALGSGQILVKPGERHFAVGKKYRYWDVIGVLEEDINHGIILKWYEYDPKEQKQKNDKVLNVYYFEDGEPKPLNVASAQSRNLGWLDVIRWLRQKETKARENNQSFVFGKVSYNGTVLIKNDDALPFRGILSVGLSLKGKQVIGILKEDLNYGTVLEWYEYDVKKKRAKEKLLNIHYFEGGELKALNTGASRGRPIGYLDFIHWIDGKAVKPRPEDKSFVIRAVRNGVAAFGNIRAERFLPFGGEYNGKLMKGILKDLGNGDIAALWYEVDLLGNIRNGKLVKGFRWVGNEIRDDTEAIRAILDSGTPRSEVRLAEFGEAKRPMTVMMSRGTIAEMTEEQFTAFYKVYAGRSEIRKVIYTEPGEKIQRAELLDSRLAYLKQMGGVVESAEDGAGAMKYGIPGQPFFYINEGGLPEPVRKVIASAQPRHFERSEKSPKDGISQSPFGLLRNDGRPQVWGVRLKKGVELLAVPLIFEPGSGAGRVLVDGQDIIGLAAFERAYIQEWMSQQVIGWSA